MHLHPTPACHTHHVCCCACARIACSASNTEDDVTKIAKYIPLIVDHGNTTANATDITTLVGLTAASATMVDGVVSTTDYDFLKFTPCEVHVAPCGVRFGPLRPVHPCCQSCLPCSGLEMPCAFRGETS
jgi:hypothetical protein